MRKGILLWFFTLLCVQVQFLALGDLHKQESRHPNISSYQLAAHKKQEIYKYNVNVHEEEQVENLKPKFHAFGKKTSGGKGAKGSYGGGDVVHRRPNSKSAASVLGSPVGCISTTNVCISLSLLLALPHLIA